MSSAFAIVFFYLLLALAVVVLRGDLTDWPRVADRALAFAICLGAVAFLLKTWRGFHPAAMAAADGSSRPRPVWLWWLGFIGLMAFVFLAVLPPASVWIARPQNVERTAAGNDSPSATPPPPSLDGTLPQPGSEGEALRPSPSAGNGAAARIVSETETGSGFWERLRDLWRQKPPWLVALLTLLAALALAVLVWWLRREWRSIAREAAREKAAPRPWFDEPGAPGYVREFRRLCDQLGLSPQPGDTWNDLIARLRGTPVAVEGFHPIAAYHYRVRYEGAGANPDEEKNFARLIRGVRKTAAASAREPEE